MRVCKYCGCELTARVIKANRHICEGCKNKSPLLPRFVAARDRLRKKAGLAAMGEQIR